MGKIIAITNQKGGVGKTTTCVNLAAALKSRGMRILICDFDPQGNCTSGMGVDKSSTPGMYEVLIGKVEAPRAVVRTKYGDVLPTNIALSGAGLELVDLPEREYYLKKALEPARAAYDYIFIDCPPSLELLTVNALVAADSVLIPVQCEYYALEGLTDLVSTIKITGKRLNKDLKIEGIVMTMYDSRIRLSDEVTAEVRKYFGKTLFATTIPRNVRLAEAPSHGKPAIAYDKMSKGSRAYLHLANELIKRQKETGGE